MQQTLTEVDQIAMFATNLDQFLCGIEEETVRTVAIHVFVRLTSDDHTIDIANLGIETDLSRRAVKHALYALTLAGKIKRIGLDKPRRYKLIKGRESMPKN